MNEDKDRVRIYKQSADASFIYRQSADASFIYRENSSKPGIHAPAAKRERVLTPKDAPGRT